MNKTRTLFLSSLALLLAACASAPTIQPALPAPKPQIPDLSGDWILTTRSRVGAESANMSIRQTGTALVGTLTSSRGSFDYTGSVQGSAVDFSVKLKGFGANVQVDYSGTVDGDTMQGKTVFGSFGEGSFSARRKGT